ncbi:dotG [Symbiodinium sp. CCMP2456]|nr:dotG [Symbiodinium sp. CCMP2456]
MNVCGEVVSLQRQTKMASVRDLRAQGFPYRACKLAGYTLKDFRESDALNLPACQQAGITADELMDAGYSRGPLLLQTFQCSYKDLVSQLKFNPKHFCKARVPLQDCRDAAGESGRAFREAGYTAADFRGAGFLAGDCRTAGFDGLEVLEAGYTKLEFEDAGYTKKQFNKAVRAFLEAGYTAEIRGAGFLASDFKTAGLDVLDCLKAGYTKLECEDAGYKQSQFNVRAFREAGHTAADFRGAGLLAADCRTAGFDGLEVLEAGYTRKQCKKAGYDDKDLRDPDSDAETGPDSDAETGMCSLIRMRM